MRPLNFALKQLVAESPEGGRYTRRDRQYALSRVATTLEMDLGFRGLEVRGLRLKHVHALVAHWHEKGLSVGAMKNLMWHVRWWAARVDKGGMIPKDNAALGIGMRRYVTNEDKSRDLEVDKLNAVGDDLVKLSLRLQEAFGLRREEAIKFTVAFADRGDSIRLKASWTKGGRAREVPITSVEQRQLLDEVRARAGGGSLIPGGMMYSGQRNRYVNECRRVGLDHMHGLRHRYAQRRYEQLTGWRCPTAGGPRRRQLKGRDRRVDRDVRLEISRELGHGRLEVVAVYLGS